MSEWDNNQDAPEPAEAPAVGIDNVTGEPAEIPENNDPAQTGVFPADAYPEATDDATLDGTQLPDAGAGELVEEGDAHEGEAEAEDIG